MSWIEVPIRYYDDSQDWESLGLEDARPEVDKILKIRPEAIDAYAEGLDSGVNLYLRSGESFRIYLTVEEFEYILNDKQ